jgi:hypothetical protein
MMHADEALAIERDVGDSKPGPAPYKHDAAMRWLQERLANGPVLVGDPNKPEPGTIRGDVAAAGISWATVRRASDRLGVEKKRCPVAGKYQWSLPEVIAHDCPKASDLSNQSNQLNSGTNGQLFDSLHAGCPSSLNMNNGNGSHRERALL